MMGTSPPQEGRPSATGSFLIFDGESREYYSGIGFRAAFNFFSLPPIPSIVNNTKEDVIGHRERLKERYLKNGAAGLQVYEVLELLLTYAIARRDVKPLAKKLLKEFKSFRGVLSAAPDELQTFGSLSQHTSILLKLVRDCSDLYLKEEVLGKETISSPQALIDYCRSAMAGLKNEYFRCLFLNTKNKVLADEIIQEGTISQAVVYPRKVIERAIYHKATALIFVHNHPSGDVKPSSEDLSLTETLKKAAAAVGIAVHDHLIVGEEGSFSFREEGLL